jgi:hypothetical protein
MAKVVESLLGKYKALSSKLQYHQKKKKIQQILWSACCISDTVGHQTYGEQGIFVQSSLST